MLLKRRLERDKDAFQRVLDQILEFFKSDCVRVILHGSYLNKFRYHDIDIAIIVESKPEWDEASFILESKRPAIKEQFDEFFQSFCKREPWAEKYHLIVLTEADLIDSEELSKGFVIKYGSLPKTISTGKIIYEREMA